MARTDSRHGTAQVLAVLSIAAGLAVTAAVPSERAVAAEGGGAGTALLWPIEATPAIVSTFGEYRYDHLHAGVDISTGGRTGLPVRAVAAGAIYRLKVEWRGYGRALYVRHPDGGTTVYGHLNAFDEAGLGLESRVAARRAEGGTPYPGDIFIDPPIPVRRGQVIGVSGESGVGLPHLHFEVRGPGDDPIDPFRAGLRPPADETPPTLDSIVLGAASPETFIAGSWREKTIPLSRSGAQDRRARIEVRGPFTATLTAWDPAGGGRAGLAQVTALLDGEPCYGLEIPGFRFEQYPVAGLIYDHRRSHLSPTTMAWRLSRLPGNTFARADCAVVGVKGVAFAPDPGVHRLEVVARDAAGRERRGALEIVVPAPAPAAPPAPGAPPGAALPVRLEARFHPTFMEIVTGVSGGVAPPALDACSAPGIGSWASLDGGALTGVALDYEEASALAARFAAGGLGPECPLEAVLARTAIGLARPGQALGLEIPGARVEIPAGGRFFPGPLVLSPRTPTDLPSGLRPVGEALDILPDGEALDDRAVLAMGFDPAAESAARLGIFRFDAVTRRWSFEGDDTATRALRCRFRRYGRFALLADESPPKILAVRPADRSVTGRRPPIAADVSEVGKGLDWNGVEFELDGAPVPAEYDPDRGVARPFTPPVLDPGSHRLRVTAVDRAGNRSNVEITEFTVR